MSLPELNPGNMHVLMPWSLLAVDMAQSQHNPSSSLDALMAAASAGDVRKVQQLIGNGAVPRARTAAGSAPFHAAAMAGRVRADQSGVMPPGALLPLPSVVAVPIWSAEPVGAAAPVPSASQG